VELTLMGDGADTPRLQALAERLGVLDRDVIFRGRVPYEDASRELPSFDVGVIPHFENDHCNTTIPNKIFDYMASGLTVIASSARPLARVVGEVGCGKVFRSQDSDDLADQIQAVSDAEFRRGCAEAGRAAVTERYHWAHDARSMVESLERLVGEEAAASRR
jgi:glycosyltransferase involved in cell wall biosynthesis